MDAKKIGEFIQKRRQELNLTQEELASKLYVSNKTISKWENGRGLPSVDLLIPISKALKVELKELLSGTKEAQYEDLLIKEIKSRKKENKIKLLLGILLCLFFCFLEVVLYLAGVSQKYAYLIFGMIFILFLFLDIANFYLSKRK